MPFYDETFIRDDNLNQKRNKRSYHVYKQGLGPIRILESTQVLHALEERGTSAIKHNIRNIKYRGRRNKVDSSTSQSVNEKNGYKTPDIIIDHCLPVKSFQSIKYHDLCNNNVNLLASCKSLDNLAWKQLPCNEDACAKIKNGASLQNLLSEETLKHYTSVEEVDELTQKCDSHAAKSYCVVEPRRRVPHRSCEAAPSPGPGIYRQFNSESICSRKLNGTNYYYNFPKTNKIICILFWFHFRNCIC